MSVSNESPVSLFENSYIKTIDKAASEDVETGDLKNFPRRNKMTSSTLVDLGQLVTFLQVFGSFCYTRKRDNGRYTLSVALILWSIMWTMIILVITTHLLVVMFSTVTQINISVGETAYYLSIVTVYGGLFISQTFEKIKMKSLLSFF